MSERIAIVVSEFYYDIAEDMLNAAEAKIKEWGATVSNVFKVKGSFDMVLPVQKLIQRKDVDAVVVLGAIVKGETKHDEIIAQAIASKILDISVETEKPIGFGISGPGMNLGQAKVRAGDSAENAVNSVIQNLRGLSELK